MTNKNIILTLDAGGTNLVFQAINKDNNIICEEIIPSESENINQFLDKLIIGFSKVNNRVDNKAAAISFCFPGPADYEAGIIGDLENLPIFRGGIALKPFLEEKFNIPVFINNDGDLFTLGEAIGGILPKINDKLHENGNHKKYQNLLGVTLGTGTGGGIVINNKLITGDNSAGAEINRSNNFLNPQMSIEETLSIRGIMNLYVMEAGISWKECPEPVDICLIADGKKEGNKKAAIEAWNKFGIVLGHALANAITLVDGLIVIGGGLAGAHKHFMPKVIEEMNGQLIRYNGESVQRLEVFAYNLENPNCYADFIKNDEIEVAIPRSDKKVFYSPIKKIGIGISKLGTSNAVSIGAHAFADEKINGK